MKSKMKILFFFVIAFVIISSHFYSQDKPPLFVWIDNYIEIEELSKLPKSKILHPEDIEKELEKRYDEVWAADKSQWPDCIRKVFENLKDFPDMTIRWELDEKFQKWYYQGDCDMGGTAYHGATMVIRNVYANKFHVTDELIKNIPLDKTRINSNMWFKSAGMILHEMIHEALGWNEYRKKVRNKKGEVVDSSGYEPKVEDCTSLIFNNAIRYYDLRGLNDKKNIPDDCNCENKEGKYKISGIGGSGGSPGNDHGDENAAFSNENITQFNINSNAIIYMNGYFREMNALAGGVFFEGIEPAQKLLDVSPLLIIPSGGLYGKEHDDNLKLILAEYVRLGGNILVLAQQADAHYSILPGCKGKPLRGEIGQSQAPP